MTTKLKLKTSLSIVFSLVLLAVPAISLAVIPVGSSCTPDILPPYANGAPSQTAICPVPSYINTNILHLKWDLQGNYKDPDCQVSCARIGLSVEIICDSLNPFRGPNGPYNWSLKGRDANNFLSATSTQQNFKSKDDVYINNAQVGDTYSIQCHEKDTLPPNQNRKVSILANVEKVEACEVGFNKILNDLVNGTKTTVTEENFYNWTSPDLKDNNTLSMGLGSGDKMDVIKTMDGMQSCQRLPNPADPDYYSVKMTGYDNVISTIKNSVDNYDPIMIGIVTKKADIGHALLALSFKTTSDPSKPVVIEAFDSNNTNMTISLTCKKEQDLIPGQGYYYFLSCQLPARLTDYRVFIPLTLNSQRVDCGILNRVRPQPTNWLAKSGNTPSFENSTTTNNTKGICYGYSEFVRNVACFGDFSGTDYHPGDGKYVGKDCDASHNIILTNRLQPKKTNNWLASIYQAFSALLPF